jgi:hypothetical protein
MLNEHFDFAVRFHGIVANGCKYEKGGNLAKLLMRGCKLKSLTVCPTGATARLFYICCYQTVFINLIKKDYEN